MPEHRPPANVEAALVAYLASNVALRTALGASSTAPRISTQLPPDFPETGAKWLHVFLVSGTVVDGGTQHVRRPLVQVNAHGATPLEAWAVYAAADAALAAAPAATYTGAVISAADLVTGPSASPDPITSAPRYTSAWAIVIHPTA